LLEHVNDNVIKVIPQLILPLKAVLNTREVEIISVALKVKIILHFLITETKLLINFF
jgi:hypothetical protein